jgi:RNA polymerase sigma-70 factor (sigma-E family)
VRGWTARREEINVNLTGKDGSVAGGRDFADFVVARGPSLHRTALLLTHQGQAAQDLVQIALAKAWRSWAQIGENPEAEVRRIMINEFASSRRWRWRGELPELPTLQGVDDDRVDDDGGDEAVSMHQVLMAALTILPRRQRAVVVLRFFHGYPEEATAEALGVKVSTVKSQTVKALAALRVFEELRQGAAPDLSDSAQAGDAPLKRTLHDLRVALREQADAAACPDIEALVAGARLGVAASRRRRFGVLGATTVAILVVGGVIATTRPTHQAVPPTAGLGPFTVSLGGDGFPVYSPGMKRLIVLDAPMLEQMNGSISVPTTAGRQLAVAMMCTPADNADRVVEWANRMYADFTIAGARGDNPACSGPLLQAYANIGTATSAKTTVLADVMIDHKSLPAPGLLFKDARIHVAIYESVPWQDYPFPPRPADLESNAQYAWAGLPGTVRVLGPTTTQEANKPLTFTQPSGPNLSLNLQVRAPGRMRVLVNGKDISERVGPTLTPDKFIAFWGYGVTGMDIPLDADSATKPDAPVTVTIDPQDFQGTDWRIVVHSNPPNGG